MERSEPGVGQPYLCQCGSVVNVAEIAVGTEFRCPTCGSQQRLEHDDPALLRGDSTSGGVYDMLLEERMAAHDEMPSAVAVSGSPRPPAGSDPLPHAMAQPASVPATPGAAQVPDNDPDRRPETRTLDTSGGPALPTAILTEGAQLGPFTIARKLGQGGMGTVYEAFDNALERTVAVKVLSEELGRDRETVDRFQREARSAGSLTHPNITHIYSISEHEGTHFFAMELVTGQTLAELLDGVAPAISVEDALDYLLQIARGLRAAKQKKIIHRDIKPSNLILGADGVLKITDFGLAKIVTSQVDITATGVIMGTPLYMSPEQGKGEPVDHRTDIYSLGCTFYHLLSGQPPYTGDNPMAIIVRHITEEPPVLGELTTTRGKRLARVILKMMSKNPADRYEDYEQLAEAISAVTASTSSARLEAAHGRVVLVSEEGEENLPADSLSLKLLSVADVSMELGRYEKALNLYQKVLADNPQLETDLCFRMLKIYQQQGDQVEVERMYERILASSEDVGERYFCSWKLLSARYEDVLSSLETARESLKRVLSEPIPEQVTVSRLRQRMQQLQELGDRLAADRDEGIVLIRRTGDLQIELD